jgi:hypothetical protein
MLPSDSLMGSLVVSTPPGVSAPALHVLAYWDEQRFYGDLSGEVIQAGQRGSTTSTRLVSYAVWPPPRRRLP